MKLLYTFFIFIIITIIFSIDLLSQSTESGWIESGNIKYQKYETDTISMVKLSMTGDTIYTLDKSGLRFWDFNTGKQLFEKKSFVRTPHFSNDMKSYTYTENLQNYAPTNVEIYDLFTDSLIKRFLAHDNSNPGGIIHFSPYPADYDMNRNILFFAYYYYTLSGYTTTTQNGTLNFKISNDTVKIIPGLCSFPYNFNEDYSKLSYIYNYQSIDTHNKLYFEKSEIGYYNREKSEKVTIISNKDFGAYKESKFTNLPDKFSAKLGNDIEYWDLTSKLLINTIHFDYNTKYLGYLFVGNDNYLAYITDKIYFKDVNTSAIIDSVSFLENSKKICMDYNSKTKRFVFSNDNKLCIYYSDYFNNPEKVFFTSDSDYVYTTKQIRFHNKSTIEYDSLRWYLSDGQTSTEDKPIFTFKEPQKITVTLKIFKDGKTYELARKNLIEVYPLLNANFTIDTTSCGVAPFTVNFKDLSVGKIISWEWNFGVDYQVNSKEKDPVYTFITPGRYVVALTVSDGKSKYSKYKYFLITTIKKNYKTFDILNTRVSIQDRYQVNGDYYYTLGESMATDVNNDQIRFIYYSSAYLSKFYKFEILDSNLTNSSSFGPSIYTYQYFNDNRNFIVTLDDSLYYLFFSDNQSNYLYGIDAINGIAIGNSLNNSNTIKTITKASDSSIFVSADIKKNNSKSILYKFNKNLILTDSCNIDSKIIDMAYLSKNNIMILSDKDNEIFLNKINNDSKILKSVKINRSNFDTLTRIFRYSKSKFAIVGKSNSGKAALALYDSLFNELWYKEFPDWQYFTNITQNGNNFFLSGKNLDSLPGFIEISKDGKDYNNYLCFTYNGSISYDVDKFNENTLLLTYDFNSTSRVIKILYEPLYQDSKIDSNDLFDTYIIKDTIPSIDTTKIVKSFTYSPNPSENFIDATLPEKSVLFNYFIYDVAGIEVKRAELNATKTDYFKIDIKDLSTGMYFIQLNTEKGKITDRLIKY
jgi:PKD repeat protein